MKLYWGAGEGGPELPILFIREVINGYLSVRTESPLS